MNKSFYLVKHYTKVYWYGRDYGVWRSSVCWYCCMYVYVVCILLSSSVCGPQYINTKNVLSARNYFTISGQHYTKVCWHGRDYGDHRSVGIALHEVMHETLHHCVCLCLAIGAVLVLTFQILQGIKHGD